MKSGSNFSVQSAADTNSCGADSDSHDTISGDIAATERRDFIAPHQHLWFSRAPDLRYHPLYKITSFGKGCEAAKRPSSRLCSYSILGPSESDCRRPLSLGAESDLIAAA
ncbi:hypothetical protein B0H13DRAFT_1872653 [Mycena leptocephala]|nr:hypothetical protein B0H13DRAFT_1872653 [Mycena leptocephala]